MYACGDHPRVCGEHRLSSSAISPLSGSSPRMRGARIDSVEEHIHLGIIPAYAGSILRRKSEMALDQDHPRVCGEHIPLSRVKYGTVGSSPRMRGALILSFIVPLL